MSREIKFRAWNTELKEMWETATIQEIMKNEWETSDIELLELMQFTGLKDKFGKEIYEGDIVRLYFDEDEVDGWLWLTLTDKQKKEGYFDREVTIPEFYQNALPDEIEVIGNIYDNPELLATPITKKEEI